ncbi:hypothetical protein EMCRGX_G031341 [Ephydatia muelleri]|eukprot:Em0018g670a
MNTKRTAFFALLVISGLFTILYLGILLQSDVMDTNYANLAKRSTMRNVSQMPFLFNHTAGHLNYDIWRWTVGFMVDDLRIKRDFPHNPTFRTSTGSLKIEFNEVAGFSNERGKYGHRIYGFLYPPATGKYNFIIEFSSKYKAMYSFELWLSTDADPMKISRLALTHQPQSWWSSRITLVSKSYWLLDGNPYYFEFFEKAFNGMLTAELKWKLSHESDFISISPNCFQMAVELDYSGQYAESSPMANVLLLPVPSVHLQELRRVTFVGDTIYPVTPLDVLPVCDFKAEYAFPRKIKKYNGVYQVFASSVYPADETWSKNYQRMGQGNSVVAKEIVSNLLHLYKDAFNRSQYRGEVMKVHYLEQTENRDSGLRFLLELEIKLQKQNKLVYTSEYIYRPANHSELLCHTSNFEWTPSVDVYVVISLKNLGQWFVHLVENMEDLYAQTHDDHFELVVVDYESQDMDVESVLKNSTLKRWKYIKKTGSFSRSGGLQAGIDYVEDPNSIVLTIDMHLTIPFGFIEYTRRHVVQGKMGFSPMFFRLHPGFTEININGFWELMTYGVFGMYKSDWSKFGGFDLKKYTTKWGGEDWDIVDKVISNGYEIFRIRYPGLVHYYHSRAGMWTGHR